MPRAPFIGFFFLVLLEIAACDGCGEDPAVPFGLHTQAEGQADPAERAAAVTTEQPGLAFAAGTRSVAIEGAPVASPTGGDIRAVLPHDFDGDGDRDALLVLVDAEGTVSVARARREASVFGEVSALGELLGASACAISEASLAAIATGYAAARITRTCDDGGPGTERNTSIISLEAEPRLRERITLLPAVGRAPLDVTIAVRPADHDEDGLVDVVLDVEVAMEAGEEPARGSIAWLDRTGGLARDTAEPETTLAALGVAARDALARDPETAFATAQRALALHAVLCREGPGPRLRFGPTEGLPCGASEGAGRAAAVAASALARAGDVFPALEAWSTLASPAFRVPNRDRREAERALSAMRASTDAERIDGPAIAAPTGTATRLSVVAFLDDDRVLVRAAAPFVFSLDARTSTPADPRNASTLVTDPQGRFVVTGVSRTCDGHVLSIARAEDVVGPGVVVGQPRSTPLLAPRAPPPSAHCPSIPERDRADDGGYRVVGWAPQGVVAVRGAETRVVPLTVEGEAAGEPESLDGATPTPAPLPPGAMPSNGRGHAVATQFGIAVHDRSAGSTVLLRPEGWDAAATSLLDVAVSPSLQAVAYVASGRLVILRR